MEQNDDTVFPFQKRIACKSRGIVYQVTLNARTTQFLLSVEEDTMLDRWACVFDAETIEIISARAGSTKKYMIFVQMLCRAMEEVARKLEGNFEQEGESKSIYLQILQKQQLQKLQNKEADGDDKLFVILQFKNEFEHIFYPLTLIKVLYDQDHESNEQYLLSQYKQSKIEIQQLQQQLKIAQSTQQNQSQKSVVQNSTCGNCSYLNQQLTNLKSQIEQQQLDKEEMLRAIELINQSKQGYKNKYREHRQRANQLDQQVQTLNEEIKQFTIQNKQLQKELLQKQKHDPQPHSRASSTYSQNSFSQNQNQKAKKPSRPISRNSSISDETFSRSINSRSTSKPSIYETYQKTKQSKNDSKLSYISQKGPPKRKESPFQKDSQISEQQSKQSSKRSKIEDIDKRLKMMMELVEKMQK